MAPNKVGKCSHRLHQYFRLLEFHHHVRTIVNISTYQRFQFRSKTVLSFVSDTLDDEYILNGTTTDRRNPKFTHDVTFAA